MFKSLLLLTTILLNSTVETWDDRFTWSNYAMESFKSRDKTQRRIVGGTLAEDNLAPYMVELAAKFHGDSHMCGGALISNRTVITAAHCCDPFKNGERYFHVKFDGIDRSSLKQTRTVSNLIRHPLYTWDEQVPSDYDYCILQLDSEVIPSDTVKFIRIAEELPVDGDRVLALGWGRTSFKSPSSPILKQATYGIIDNTNCKLDNNAPVRDSYICVNEPGVSTCFGDSGGPLVFNKRLVGVLSFGDKHCTPGYTSVFANVTFVKQWIDENKI